MVCIHIYSTCPCIHITLAYIRMMWGRARTNLGDKRCVFNQQTVKHWTARTCLHINRTSCLSAYQMIGLENEELTENDQPSHTLCGSIVPDFWTHLHIMNQGWSDFPRWFAHGYSIDYPNILSWLFDWWHLLRLLYMTIW